VPQSESNPNKTDDHSKDTEGRCRHCAGVAVPAMKAGDPAVGSALALQGVAAVIHETPLQSLSLSPAGADVRHAETATPPTLLLLHCALNL
jgi:hypothetical protein